MSMRCGLIGLFGAFAVAGPAAAKPPGLPAEPLVEGRELPAVVREYYEADVPPPRPAPNPTLPPLSTPAWPVADFLAGVHDAVLNWLTVPLSIGPFGK